MMTFPATVEEFMEQYKIVDDEKVYTNGSDLVPIFRMMQWFEHVSATDKNVGTTISRQQAIDVLKELTVNGTNKGMISGEDAVHRIEMLPPAQSQRTGKWISADAIFHAVPFYCSECGEQALDTVMGKPIAKYCPNCGAKMEGEAE